MTLPQKSKLPEPGDLCLVTAVDIEFKTATALLDQKIFSNESKIKICRGNAGNRRITVLQCGMGAPGFAQWLSNHLNHNRYEAMIVAGLAGGLDEKLKAGDAVIYERCLNLKCDFGSAGSKEKQSARDEKASIRCDDELARNLFELLQTSGCRSFKGVGLTVPRVITDSHEKIRLGARYEALAVDMETYDALSVCAVYGLPATALRVISDEAGNDLPDFNYASESGGEIKMSRMILAMSARPAASLRFMLDVRSVIESLRFNLKIILSA